MGKASSELEALDKILEKLTFEVLKWNYGASSAECASERLKAKAALVSLIETTMLEIIGEDEDYSMAMRAGSDEWHKRMIIRNDLRQEQRDRIAKWRGKQ